MSIQFGSCMLIPCVHSVSCNHQDDLKCDFSCCILKCLRTAVFLHIVGPRPEAQIESKNQAIEKSFRDWPPNVGDHFLKDTSRTQALGALKWIVWSGWQICSQATTPSQIVWRPNMRQWQTAAAPRPRSTPYRYGWGWWPAGSSVALSPTQKSNARLRDFLLLLIDLSQVSLLLQLAF